MTDVAELLSDPSVRAQYALLPEDKRAAFEWRSSWLIKAHKHQIIPPGTWWSIWLMLAGRGAGKTRTAAEEIGWMAWSQPGTRWLVAAPTSADLKGTCFEGDSGLISVIPKSMVLKYNSSLHEIHMTNGSLIKGIPASEPERFRGPQFHGGWCCPAGTMITMANGFHKPIEQVQVGDMVATRHGPRRVTASGISGNTNDLARIACGVTNLTTTIDHPILVGDQWISAGDIKQGDKVWVTSTLGAGTHTESFMSGMLAPSHMDGSCIIRTKTSQTTTHQTLKQCQGDSIKHFMPREEQGLMHNVMQHARRWSHFAFQSLAHASGAVKGSIQLLLVRLESFAPAIALKSGAGTSLSQSNAIVLSALLSTQRSNGSRSIAASSATPSQQSAPTAVTQREVLRAERLPNCVTYNLTVEGEHEYIANGIVVHNCDELAAWEYLQESWDMIQFCIRLGDRTMLICTTTPKPKPVVMDLISREGDDVVVTKASTYSNIANLAPSFQKQILQYEGTNLGRQEIHAEIIDPEEGGIVKREWFRLWKDEKPFPRFEFILQSYDCATSDKTVNDPTGMITLGVFKPLDGGMCVMVIDCWCEHLQYPDLRPKVIDEYEVVYGEGKDKKRVDLLLVEDKSAGISLIQDLQRANLPVHAYNPGRADKIQRLSIVANIIRAGRLWVPESSVKRGFVRDWAEGMVSQICSFPEGTEHDEYVDCISQGLRYLRDGGWISIDAPPRDTYDDDDWVDAYGTKERVNPYSI